MKIRISICLLFIFWSAVARASVLSSTAAALAPGQWTFINPTGISTGLGGCLNPTTYADSAVWSPISKKFLYIGGYGHGGPYCFVIFDDATNSYSEGPPLPGIPFSAGTPVHQYDNNTIDTATDNMYYHIDHSVWQFIIPQGHTPHDLYKYNIPTNTWSTLPDDPFYPYVPPDTCCSAIEFFPEMYGVVYLQASGKVDLYSERTGAWSQLNGGNAISGWTGSAWEWAAYSPYFHLMLLGNNTQVYKMDASGTITAMAGPPAGVSFYDGSWNANIMADPVTGNFMMYLTIPGTATYRLYMFDPNANTYTLIGDPPEPSPPFYLSIYGSITSAPIANYGVVMMQVCSADVNSCDGRMLIYKQANPPSATADYTQRCSAAGVTHCVGFNTYSTDNTSGADMICCNGQSKSNSNVDMVSGVSNISLDTTVKRSGAGSMEITAPAGLAAGHYGQYLCCGDSGIPNSGGGLNHTFAADSDMYVQMAVRFDSNYFTAARDFWQSPSKISILHVNALSCGAKEITANTNGMPSQYIAHGYFDCGSFGWRTHTDSSDMMIDQNQTPYLLQGGFSTCEYGVLTNCFDWPTDTWITIYYHFHAPTSWSVSTDGYMDVYYSINGLPYVQFEHITNLGAAFQCTFSGPPCLSEGFNNFTLLMHPNAAAAAAPYAAHVWYDEFIASTQPIRNPITLPDSGTPSATPVVMRVGAGKTVGAGAGKVVRSGMTQ